MYPVVGARLFPLTLAMISFLSVVALSMPAMFPTVCFILGHVGGLALFVAVHDLFLLCCHKDRDALC